MIERAELTAYLLPHVQRRRVLESEVLAIKNNSMNKEEQTRPLRSGRPQNTLPLTDNRQICGNPHGSRIVQKQLVSGFRNGPVTSQFDKVRIFFEKTLVFTYYFLFFC